MESKYPPSPSICLSLISILQKPAADPRPRRSYYCGLRRCTRGPRVAHRCCRSCGGDEKSAGGRPEFRGVYFGRPASSSRRFSCFDGRGFARRGTKGAVVNIHYVFENEFDLCVFCEASRESRSIPTPTAPAFEAVAESLHSAHLWLSIKCVTQPLPSFSHTHASSVRRHVSRIRTEDVQRICE
jgi:hypothetical protein